MTDSFFTPNSVWKSSDMGYELEHIEAKITENISLAAAESLNFNVPQFLKEIDEECLKIKRAFKHQVVSFENETSIKRYFRFHQESLIQLINGMQNYPLIKDDNNRVHQSILERLSGLLNYLEEHFPEYFDQDIKMPWGTSVSVREELYAFRESISERFGNRNVDIGLLELLKNSLDDFIDKGGPITFRTFYYLKLLRTNVVNIDLVNASLFETFDLIRVLMHCNYNTESFYNYMVKYVSWTLGKAQSIPEKLDHLAYFLKFANQESAGVGIAFNHNNPPINIQIAEWISQEMLYLKNKQQLLSTVSAEEILPSEFKLSFDLSVSQLAFMVRAFVETCVIQNKNTSELIRFLTKYAKTKRSESISYESFRIKYYSVEDGTKDAVKKCLQLVLNFINKH